jgi:hypothetical protein
MPRDVSTCWGCMTNSIDLLGRQMCFACITGKLDPYGCVQCASIIDITLRTKCYLCLVTNSSGWECVYGTSAPPSPALRPPPPPPWPSIPSGPGTAIRGLRSAEDRSTIRPPSEFEPSSSSSSSSSFEQQQQQQGQESQQQQRQQQQQQQHPSGAEEGWSLAGARKLFEQHSEKHPGQPSGPRYVLSEDGTFVTEEIPVDAAMLMAMALARHEAAHKPAVIP